MCFISGHIKITIQYWVSLAYNPYKNNIFVSQYAAIAHQSLTKCLHTGSSVGSLGPEQNIHGAGGLLFHGGEDMRIDPQGDFNAFVA